MITIFSKFSDMRPYYLPIDKVLARIKNGKSAELVNIIRAEQDKERKKQLKLGLPCILFGGEFTYRAIKSIQKHSGFISVDFDKFPDKDTLNIWRDSLADDIYTYSIFVSPGGAGLKCVVKIPAPEIDIYKNNKAYFRGLQAHYNCPYFDINMFDISRVCFESYDPDLIINHDSEVWTGQIFDPVSKPLIYTGASVTEQETVRRLLKWWNGKFGIANGERNVNLFRLCCAFNDFGVSPEYAHSICSQWQESDFPLKEIERVVNNAYRKKEKFGKMRF